MRGLKTRRRHWALFCDLFHIIIDKTDRIIRSVVAPRDMTWYVRDHLVLMRRWQHVGDLLMLLYRNVKNVQDCCARNPAVGWMFVGRSLKIRSNSAKALGVYVSPPMNKFVNLHPRASGDGYVVLGDWGRLQQPAAYLERFVLSTPLLEDKSFKGAHYLTIVVQSPLYS